MPRTKRWNEDTLRIAVQKSTSIRQVLRILGLVEAGGNYEQMKRYILQYKIDSSHFLGRGANRGRTFKNRATKTLLEILVDKSSFQSHKLKTRLFKAGLKKRECELCSWAKESEDGRIPLELDHINGRHDDNRFDNLRILCPNCHSLQSTHRGRNKNKNK